MRDLGKLRVSEILNRPKFLIKSVHSYDLLPSITSTESNLITKQKNSISPDEALIQHFNE